MARALPRSRNAASTGRSATVEGGFTFTFEDWNLWDDVPGLEDATTGNFEARLQKLGDPARRPGLRDVTPVLTNDWKDVFIVGITNPEI